jgi:hypothetical protein
MNDKLNLVDGASATLQCAVAAADKLEMRGFYLIECIDSEGNLKWNDEIRNIVTLVGKNDMLDRYFKGSNYTQTQRMGLKGPGNYIVGDTQSSHALWNEVGGANAPAYTGNRKDVVFVAASAGTSVTPAQSFAITSAGTVAGCFINNGGSASKDDTTGVLFAVGDFSQGGRQVLNGDTINATYSLAT